MNISQVYKRYPSRESCLQYLEDVIWGANPQCPHCGSRRSTTVPKEHRHHCNICNASYSVTAGTIFHRTRLDLQKWFLAIWLILNAREPVTCRQLARNLAVNKDTAWYLIARIQRATAGQRELLLRIFDAHEPSVGAPTDPVDSNHGGTSR